MSFIPNIPVLQAFKTEAMGHFLRWEARRETTQWASPTPHSPTGFMVLRKMAAVSWLHWPRGRATERQRKWCKGDFLHWAGPNHRSADHQPPSDGLQSFPFQFYLPFLLTNQAWVTLCSDKKIRSSLPTSKAIFIICKEFMSGTA